MLAKRKKIARITVQDAKSSVADPGCLSRIPVTTFFHSGSRIQLFPSRIPTPHQRIYFSILTQKLFLSSRNYDPGCSSRIRILTFYPSWIPDPGVKKAPDPRSRIRIRSTAKQTTKKSYTNSKSLIKKRLWIKIENIP